MTVQTGPEAPAPEAVDTDPGIAAAVADRPSARAQVAGLTFGLLLVSPELTIEEVNPAAESLLGRSSRRLLKQHLLDVVDFGEPRIARRLLHDEGQLIARSLLLRVADRSIAVNLTVSPLSSHAGWRVVTLSDNGQGERFNDDERAGTLRGPAVLAHEIKNPLSAIKGAAQLLARKVGERERALTALITDEVERIALLIDRMQRLGRQKAEPVVPCNLHAAIRRASDTVRASSSRPFMLIEEFDPSLPPVLANEGALVQILVNLISNARDACERGDDPRVIIRTRFVSGLVLNVFRLGRPVKLPIEVRISDNGRGIDPALHENIFEPFVSSKPNGQGLGLALVHKLVRDMDGRIMHDRDEITGLTHFRVHLPLARAEDQQ